MAQICSRPTPSNEILRCVLVPLQTLVSHLVYEYCLKHTQSHIFLCLVCRLTIVMMVGWSLKGYKVTLTAKEGQAKPRESIAKVRECSRGHMVSWVPLTVSHFQSGTGNTSLYSAGSSFFFLSHKFYY